MAASSRLDQIRSASPSEVARLAYRKLIHRRVFMGRLGGRMGDSVAPSTPLDPSLDLDIWGPDRYDEVLGTNPYLSAGDLVDFHRQRSKCIVVLDGGHVVASSWMTSGTVQVNDLHRTVEVAPHEHLSCRSYVSTEYGGKALMSHMIHHYCTSVDPDDYVWGLLYPANVASIRSCDKIGWVYTGDYWTNFVLTRKIAGERHFPALPAMDLTKR